MKSLMFVFFLLCGLVLVVDILLPKHHSTFVWENWPGFYGAYGFLSYVCLVLTAKHILRPLTMRDEEEGGEEI